MVNTGTALVGDRVQIRSFRLGERRIALDVVEMGPDDTGCCPSQKATREWALDAAGLSEVESRVRGTSALADLEGTEWVLTHFDWNEPALEKPDITLVFGDSTLSGSGGCNTYFARVEPGADPGALKAGPVGRTKKHCGTEVSALEDRYIDCLEAATRWGYHVGKLAITWTRNDVSGVLLFAPR